MSKSLLIEKLELPFLGKEAYAKTIALEDATRPTDDASQSFKKAHEEREKEELEAFKNNIYDQAYLKGKEEGKAEAMALLQKDFEEKLTEKEKAIEVKLSSLTEKLIHELHHIMHYLVGFRQLQEKDTLELTRLLVSKLIDCHMPHASLHHIENMIIECFRNLYGDTSLTIYVHPEMVSPLQERIEMLAGNYHFNGEYTIRAKEDIALIDCEVTWQHGKLESSLKERWDIVNKFMDESLSILSFSKDMIDKIDLAKEENKDTLQAV